MSALKQKPMTASSTVCCLSESSLPVMTEMSALNISHTAWLAHMIAQPGTFFHSLPLWIWIFHTNGMDLFSTFTPRQVLAMTCQQWGHAQFFTRCCFAASFLAFSVAFTICSHESYPETFLCLPILADLHHQRVSSFSLCFQKQLCGEYTHWLQILDYNANHVKYQVDFIMQTYRIWHICA